MSPSFLRPIIIVAALAVATAAMLFAVSGATGPDMFMPHAHCYLFNPGLMRLHGWSDLFIGLSYVSISTTLIYLVFRARQDLPFHWMMLAFALFIVACGATHFMEVWTLQDPHPRYWLSGWVKFLTAIASLTTALLLPPLIPKIRAVLQGSRLATERKAELEKAYAELNELYRKATAATPPTQSSTPTQPLAEVADLPRDLAHMAKEVTVHARELERAKQVAEAANRAKDQFLAVLSHELRTPLTPALAAASHLEHAAELDPAEVRESLALIRRNIELEARLVDDLLDLTRISKGKLEVHATTIDLHETIRHAVEMCRSSANNVRTEVALRLDATARHVHGDGARLAQVFWNLILNAVKFTPPDSRITVRTLNPIAGRVHIEVTDNGIGIEPGLLDRIFEPFQQGETTTARRRYGGMGLGLSIAKGLVEAHGGSITAHSEGKDRGASFTIELATVDTPAPPRSSDNPLPAPIAHRSLRILLVEDHEDTRRALTRLLTRWGHFVKSAASVAEGLELAASFTPELLLSDLGLPDGTGIELLGKLRQTRDLPAIAMSGYGMESDLEQTTRAGFRAHLVKPVAADRLKETIDRLALS